MSKNAILIVSVLLISGLAAWGIVAMLKAQECQGYEDDLLNSISASKRALALRTLDTGDGRLRAAAALVEKANNQQMKFSIEQLVERCGKRASDTALRHASEANGI